MGDRLGIDKRRGDRPRKEMNNKKKGVNQ